MNKIIRKFSKGGILTYSSFFLLLILSCSVKNEIPLGFNKKILLSERERNVPITSTFYNSYIELSNCLQPKTALSKVILAPEYRVYIGVVTIENELKDQHIAISSECFSLLNISKYKGKNKFLAYRKSLYYMHYMVEDKYPLCIIVESKDSSLMSKFYKENEFISRIN